MNLHRASNKPEWESIPAGKRNRWQKAAARTRGIITPPNAVTVVGAIVALIGLVLLLRHSFLLGGSLVMIGRLLDIVDGWLAELTGTKSPLGEMMDATVDKIITGLTIIVGFIIPLAPWWLLVVVLLPQAIVVIIVAIARARNAHFHPTRPGKTSMFLLWVSLVGFVVVTALGYAWPQPLAVLIDLIAISSAVVGFFAAGQYARQVAKSARP